MTGLSQHTDNDDVVVKGGTDETPIGNVADALKVDIASTGSGLTKDFYLEIASGDIEGTTHVNKFGYNPSVGNTNLEDVWDGSSVYVFAPTAQTVEVSSDDTSDTSAGTGARTVELQGLDSNYDIISETITMNGTSDVTSSNSYLRLFRMKVITAGTQGENDGDISAIQTTSSILMAQITETQNQTLMCIYTIPAGKTGYIVDWFLTVAGNKEFEADLFIRPFGEVFQIKKKILLSSPFEFAWRPYLKVTEKSDIRVQAIASTGNAEISSGFDLILVDN